MGWRIYRCVKTDIPFYGNARDIVDRRIKWFESVEIRFMENDDMN